MASRRVSFVFVVVNTFSCFQINGVKENEALRVYLARAHGHDGNDGDRTLTLCPYLLWQIYHNGMLRGIKEKREKERKKKRIKNLFNLNQSRSLKLPSKITQSLVGCERW